MAAGLGFINVNFQLNLAYGVDPSGIDFKLETLAQNKCSADVSSTCTNLAIQHASIESTADALLHDTISLKNRCSDSSCDNTASQTGKIADNVGNKLQQIITSDNSCKSDSGCNNSVDNGAQIVDSSHGSLNTKIDQNNKCYLDSSCDNNYTGNTDVTSQNGKATENRVTQHNTCLLSSKCANTGSNEGSNGSYQNKQTSICVLGAECNNTGTNNLTVGIHGASCNNSGTNTIALCTSPGHQRIINVGSHNSLH